MSTAITTLLGNVGRVQLNEHQGQDVLNFSIAVDEYISKDKTETQWWEISVWGERGKNLAPYIIKGKKMMVVGSPHARIWKSQNGNTGITLSINNPKWIDFASSKDEEQQQAAPQEVAQPAPAPQTTTPPPDQQAPPPAQQPQTAPQQSAGAATGSPDDIPW